MTVTARTRTALRLLLTAAVAAPLAFSLGACGKKGSPKPPESEENQYTYPQAYPDPATVVPNGNNQAEEAGPLSIFTNDNRTSTKSY
jgi:predicted small lipoprotein YifL